jgi:membrane protein insertase Oxa1/YidC/SpoIIIJ
VGIILQPFAWLLLFFYRAFNSYGLALIIFGIVIKLLLFPVTLKSKKSMIQTSMLSEKMQRLQKQYGKDKERYNLEVQKLYEKENVNPMGGCLWSLIPMFVLIALFGIIREPLLHAPVSGADPAAGSGAGLGAPGGLQRLGGGEQNGQLAGGSGRGKNHKPVPEHRL